MSAIGSLVFCTACGDLLPSSTGDPTAILTCTACGAENRDVESKTVTTTSKPSAFPSALRAKRSAVRALTEADLQQHAASSTACPECGKANMRYFTRQLRSADEGTTVFFECEGCGFSMTQNN